MAHIRIIDVRKPKYKQEELFSSFQSDQESHNNCQKPSVQFPHRNTQKSFKNITNQEQLFSDFSSEDENVIENYQISLSVLKKQKMIKQQQLQIKQCQEKKTKFNQDYLAKQLLKQINELKSQIQCLKEENEKLKGIENQTVELNKKIEELEIFKNNVREENKIFKEKCVKEKKQKTEELFKEIIKLKQTAKTMKNVIQETQHKYEILIKQNEKIQKELDEKEWQSKFANIFADMSEKLCDEIESGWSMKKKVQIGWKINKNILQKAIKEGIKVPKVQKSAEKSEFMQ